MSKRSGVYFLATADRSMIKIGKSKNVDVRVSDLGNMNAARLELLAVVRGYSHVERFFHVQWKKQRSHGEWFHACPELLTFIEEAAQEPEITLSMCLGCVRLDEPDEFPRERRAAQIEVVRDQFDVLRRWRLLGGHDINKTIAILDWGTLTEFAKQRLDWADGAWVNAEGAPVFFQHVGYARSAHHLIEFSEPDDRQLAFIYAAARDFGDDKRLWGPHHDAVWLKIDRRYDVGQARHWLPTERFCNASCECRGWYDESAISEVDWLRRLAHLSDTEFVLARIVDKPPDRWNEKRAAVASLVASA